MRVVVPRVVPPKSRPPKAANITFKTPAVVTTEQDVMQEAEDRLVANGHDKVCWDDIALLRDKYSLSDQVELGLKLLHPVKLRLLLGTRPQRQELERQLDNAEAAEREQIIRATIAKFDPIVERLVQRIEQQQEIERAQEEADDHEDHDGGLDESKATEPEQVMPCTVTGIRVPPRASLGQHMPVQVPRAQPTANPLAAAGKGINAGWMPPRGKGGVQPATIPRTRSRSPRQDDPARMQGSAANEVSRKGEIISNGKGDWRRGGKGQIAVGNSLSATSGSGTPRNGQSDLRLPTGSSGNDLETFLVNSKLGAFAHQLREMGVERLADLKYVTADDLKGMGMSIIQCRKFQEAQLSSTEGNQLADEKGNKPKASAWHEQSAGDEKTDATTRTSHYQRKRVKGGVIGARVPSGQSRKS